MDAAPDVFGVSRNVACDRIRGVGAASINRRVVLYVAGTELRITSEEGALEKQFPTEYEEYRLKTRWTYVPGLR
jgi:hypothetical protein